MYIRVRLRKLAIKRGLFVALHFRRGFVSNLRLVILAVRRWIDSG